MTAFIQDLSFYGMVKVVFNDTLRVPLNLTLLSEQQAFKFQVLNGVDNTVNESNQNVTKWDIVSFKENNILIQLTFSNPLALA